MQWLKKLFRKKADCKGIVGISFLPHGVALAVSDYRKNLQLTLVHCEFARSESTEEHLALLSNWLAAYKLADYDCHLVLDINDYRRINLETPNVAENEIALAVRWKVGDLVDFSVEDAAIDYYPIPVFNRDHPMLEVIASSYQTIKHQVELCAQAGLSLEVIDIQETTLRNLAALQPHNPLGMAVLYLQKTFGIILIEKNAVIYLARRIADGYEKLEQENILAKNNSARAGHDNLALEIQRSLDYAESYYGIDSMSKVAVIPWSDSSQNLVDDLNNNYGINAYLMDLSTSIHCSISVDYATQSLCAPVIGATLRNSIAADDSTTS